MTFEKGSGSVADYAPLYTPAGATSSAVYANIKDNISSWVADAYKRS